MLRFQRPDRIHLEKRKTTRKQKKKQTSLPEGSEVLNTNGLFSVRAELYMLIRKQVPEELY